GADLDKTLLATTAHRRRPGPASLAPARQLLPRPYRLRLLQPICWRRPVPPHGGPMLLLRKVEDLRLCSRTARLLRHELLIAWQGPTKWPSAPMKKPV